MPSCKEKEEDNNTFEYDAKRANILGDWDVSKSTREFRADTLYAETGTSLEFSFHTNGTGSIKIFSFENTFDWLYQYQPERVVTASNGTLISFRNTIVYEISKNEKDRQIWEYETSTTDTIGTTILFKHTLKMNRK